MSGELQKWADPAMFRAAPMQVKRTEDGGIVPQVHLLWMTPDPLGAIAAMCRMYEGKPTYNLRDLTDEEREHYFAQVQKTHLRAPLEAVKLHFFIEGVTRSFTHQMVRQRTAVYAQESLRFAVKDDPWHETTSLPPSLAETAPPSHASWRPTDAQRMRNIWDNAVAEAEYAYNRLVELGMPAEDARGLMPHAITTRLHYVTDLRNLVEHAGNRLCTQAQFEWRIVFLSIMQAIKQYDAGDDGAFGWQWQYAMIADSPLFRPVCYQLSRCPFQASFDRACTIRDRVETFAAHGVPSSQWHETIKTEEWLLDPTAARRASGGAGH